jgi:hypothetical protein
MRVFAFYKKMPIRESKYQLKYSNFERWKCIFCIFSNWLTVLELQQWNIILFIAEKFDVF